MPVFIYKAKKENAEAVSGELTAANSEEAVELLSRKGLLPVLVTEKPLYSGVVRDQRSRPVGLKVLFIFTRQLVSLLKSGVSLLQAVELLAKQASDRSFAWTLTDVVNSIRNGRSFSAALSEHPRVFSDLYVSMARAGEESGELRDLLAQMAIYYRKQDEVISKIRTALAYPIFMLVVGIMSVLFILTYVMPRITVLFDGLNTQLPWPTVFVMSLSAALAKGWPILFVVILVLLIFFRSVEQAQKLRRGMKRFMFSIPLISGLALKIDAERFARTLGLLLSGGVQILRALEIAIPTLDNEPMKQALWVCHGKVSGGMGFGEALKDASIIPEIFAQLVTVGEESGSLASSLQDIADSYEQEINETTKAVTSLLEPSMILIVGLVIGFIVFAMLMPVFQMDIFSR